MASLGKARAPWIGGVPTSFLCPSLVEYTVSMLPILPQAPLQIRKKVQGMLTLLWFSSLDAKANQQLAVPGD